MNTAVLFSSARDDWRTPPELFAKLDAEFNFDVDAAASIDNTLCKWFWGPIGDSEGGRDAIAVNWSTSAPMLGRPPVCYCNPPYSRGMQKHFIAKAALERLRGVTTVMLIPARTDTKAFHAFIWDAEKHQPRKGVEVRFLPGRIKFVGAKHGAPFPSMIVVFRGESA